MTHTMADPIIGYPGPFGPNPLFENIKASIKHKLDDLPEGTQNAIDAFEKLPPSGLSEIIKGPAGTLLKMWEVGIYAYITVELGKDLPATVADKIPWEPIEPTEPEIVHFDDFSVSGSSSNTISPDHA